MTENFFSQQWKRLEVRFGAKAMDPELKMLVAREVHDMSERAFQRAVDVWIGSRPHTKPPLLAEFREAALAERKYALDRDTMGALISINRKAPDEMKAQMRGALSKEFGAVSSVKEAMEVARIRQRVDQADAVEKVRQALAPAFSVDEIEGDDGGAA